MLQQTIETTSREAVMFRRFVVVSTVLVAICALLLLDAAMAQSKEEGIRLYNEALTLQRRAHTNTDLHQAVQKYQQVLKIFERVGFKQGIGATVNNLSSVY